MHSLTSGPLLDNTSVRRPNGKINFGDGLINKLPEEIIKMILFESFNWNVSDLAKCRLVNDQWKKLIDENVFTAYYDFIRTCLTPHPNPVSRLLSGEFIEDDTFSFLQKIEDFSYSNNNNRAKKIGVDMTQFFCLDSKNRCGNVNESKIVSLESMNIRLHSDIFSTGTDSNHQLQNKISLILIQSCNHLRFKGIRVSLTGLSNEVTKENALRINNAIEKTLRDPKNNQFGDIWYNHHTGLIEGFKGKDCAPVLYDGAKEEDLANRKKDIEVYFSNYTYKSADGLSKYAINRFVEKINMESWSLKARLSSEIFWSER